MALQSSGQITLKQIAAEFEDTAPHTLKEFYAAAGGVPSSGEISLKDFYGKSNVITMTVLLVAGGGGAGSGQDGRPAGGGGAGGVLYGTMDIAPGTYSFTIGAAGAGTSNTNSVGANGGNTVFNGATAIGGGGGASARDYYSGPGASDGGSGGGGGVNVSTRTPGSGIQGNSGGLTGYGNDGATPYNFTGISAGAGGGGAGGAGQPGDGSGTTYDGGDGGIPKSFTVGGTSYSVARGGNAIYGSTSGGGYGNGGNANGGSGSAGVLIIAGPTGGPVVKTASGTLTIASDGTVS